MSPDGKIEDIAPATSGGSSRLQKYVGFILLLLVI